MTALYFLVGFKWFTHSTQLCHLSPCNQFINNISVLKTRKLILNFISGADPWKERCFAALLFPALLGVLSQMGQHMNTQRTNPESA